MQFCQNYFRVALILSVAAAAAAGLRLFRRRQNKRKPEIVLASGPKTISEQFQDRQNNFKQFQNRPKQFQGCAYFFLSATLKLFWGAKTQKHKVFAWLRLKNNLGVALIFLSATLKLFWAILKLF